MSVKKGIEHYLYFSHQPTTIVGGIKVNGPADGDLDTTIPNVSALPILGQVLLIMCEFAVLSDDDIDIDVDGTDPADAALTGNAVIPGRAARTRAVKVETAGADDLYKTVASITVNSGGVAGDTMIILGIPEYDRVLVGPSSWNYVPFFDGFDPDLGTGFEAIYDHYKPDHFKRTRLTNEVSVSGRYIDVEKGLSPMDGAEVSLRIEVKPDGKSLVSEQKFVAKAKMTVTQTIPEGEGIVTVTADGAFSEFAQELLVADQ